MDQLIPGMAALVEAFRDAFHPSVFETFRSLVCGWVVCTGPRTISEVWQAVGLAGRRHHDAAYAVFRSARWDWEDLGIVLARLILDRLVAEGPVWVAVDDTLCHKRGAKVAFGGIFLDAVLSSRRHKTFRFGLNWVVLGIVVALPMRPDRHFCLPVLWKLHRKKGAAGHRPRPRAAAELARRLAEAFPGREFRLVGDSAYVNAALLRDRPANLHVVGPLHWKAALYGRPDEPAGPRRGRPRKKGARLPTPAAMIADVAAHPAEEAVIPFPRGARTLRVQVIRDVLWYRGAKESPVAVVLVRDPSGAWRDEALVTTDPAMAAEAAILGYCRRWSVELAFFDGKQHLGLHDPRVRCERSVERAHPTAWFAASLTILWYCAEGHAGPHVERARPWYKKEATPTFSDMLGALRLQTWRRRTFGDLGAEPPSTEFIERLLHTLSAVA